MTAPVLLDMTRAVVRRFKGETPSGIDRVCDAYATHFAGQALAVLQLRGRMLVLDRAASDRLFASLDQPRGRFRRAMLSILAKSPWSMVSEEHTQGAFYVNVSHTDFDLDAHWRSVRRRGLKPVYLLHDLIPLTHPEITTPHKVARHRGRVVHALQNAHGIIVNSHATGAELHGFATTEGLPLPDLLVAPIAGANLPVPLHPVEHETQTFVSVGTIEARKNHMLLLRVWSRLIDRLGEATPRLILAGSWGLRSSDVRKALENDERFSGFVEVRSGLDDAELANLIASARGVLLPSFAEGYGLPMVEALRLRVPVIASDLPSFREIGQGIPTLLDPADIEAWTNNIADFAASGAEWQRQLASIIGFVAPVWDAHFCRLDRWLAGRFDADQANVSEESLPATPAAGHTARVDRTTTRQDREAQC